MKKVDLNALINAQDVNGLKKVVVDIKNLKDNFERDPSIIYNSKVNYLIVADYYKKICEFERQVFRDQSTCDITNGVKNTVPYQLGLVKAYCAMILNK